MPAFSTVRLKWAETEKCKPQTRAIWKGLLQQRIGHHVNNTHSVRMIKFRLLRVFQKYNIHCILLLEVYQNSLEEVLSWIKGEPIFKEPDIELKSLAHTYTYTITLQIGLIQCIYIKRKE